MESPVVKFFCAGQERTDILPAILYAIDTPEFQMFANAVHDEDPTMSFVDIVQVYILVTGPTSGNKQICASHEQLKVFMDDPSAGNKSLYKDVKMQTKLTSEACAEAAAMFMELHEFFKSSKVKGHDGIANPNELFTMRWFFATVLLSVYKSTPECMEQIVPIAQALLIVYTALDRKNQDLTTLEREALLEPGFVCRVSNLPVAAMAQEFHNALDKTVHDKAWNNMSAFYPVAKFKLLHQDLKVHKIRASTLLNSFGLSYDFIIMITNMVTTGDSITKPSNFRGLSNAFKGPHLLSSKSSEKFEIMLLN